VGLVVKEWASPRTCVDVAKAVFPGLGVLDGSLPLYFGMIFGYALTA
jgi:hypothetical protein